MRNILVILTLLVALVSCQKFPDQVKSIEKLEVTADSLQKVWLKMDTLNHASNYEEIMSNLKYFKLYLNQELVSREEQIHELSDYRGFRKTFKRFASYKSNFETEIPHRIQQLKDLKQDVGNGVFETEDAVNTAINDETARLMKLKSRIEEMDKHIPALYKTKSRLDVFVDTLKIRIKKHQALE